MKPVALLVFLLLSAAPKSAVNGEAPKFEDAGELKSRLQLVTDGKGHYLAMDSGGGWRGPFFYGDGKALYQLRSPGGGAAGKEQFNVSMWDPRIEWANNGYASFDFKDGKYSITCPPKTTPLTVVPADEARKLIEAMVLYQARWQRRPHKLARDDKGTYYFVDCAQDETRRDCARDWRLYVGPRGKLKLQQMTNIVSDSVGQIFSTRGGELRLVLNEDAAPSGEGVVERKDKEMKWVSGKEVTPLINVPVDGNLRMIFTDLGVYDREKLGTPCDDL
jgi:hypothetical protein